MLANPALKEEEKEFGLKEIAKAIQLPLTDFVTQYTKFRSAVQNARNIRKTVPKRFASMLVDLAARDLDKVLYGRVCETFQTCLVNTERTSARLYAKVLKSLLKIKSQDYRAIVCAKTLAPVLVQIGAELQEEIPNANKQTVEMIVKKCAFARRLLYTLNKNKAEANELVSNYGSELGLSQNAGELLLKL